MWRVHRHKDQFVARGQHETQPGEPHIHFDRFVFFHSLTICTRSTWQRQLKRNKIKCTKMTARRKKKLNNNNNKHIHTQSGNRRTWTACNSARKTTTTTTMTEASALTHTRTHTNPNSIFAHYYYTCIFWKPKMCWRDCRNGKQDAVARISTSWKYDVDAVLRQKKKENTTRIGIKESKMCTRVMNSFVCVFVCVRVLGKKDKNGQFEYWTHKEKRKTSCYDVIVFCLNSIRLHDSLRSTEIVESISPTNQPEHKLVSFFSEFLIFSFLILSRFDFFTHLEQCELLAF